MLIPDEIKKECIERKLSGEDMSTIYKFFVDNTESKMSPTSFVRKVNYWKKERDSDEILEASTLNGAFKPKWGTVQLDGSGNIERAWIRGADDESWKEEILLAIKESKPLLTERLSADLERNKTMLEIPLMDMHFGIADFAYYKGVQADVMEHVRKWHDTIVFAIGSDLFHNNDHRGRTAKGMPIEHVDMCKAYNEALSFYVPLIAEALENAHKVKIIYIKGNHDESPSYFFCKHLEALFPSADFNLDFVEKKVVTWEKIFIGYTHGDKGKNAIPEVFIRKWAVEWATSEVREIHTGHNHVEKVRDSYGTRMRSLPTANITDGWSEDNAFEGAVKEFQLFEYGSDRIRAIYPVYAK